MFIDNRKISNGWLNDLGKIRHGSWLFPYSGLDVLPWTSFIISDKHSLMRIFFSTILGLAMDPLVVFGAMNKSVGVVHFQLYSVKW